MQKGLSFQGSPLSGVDLVTQLTEKLQSIASNRKGSVRPSDIQVGEMWVNDSGDPNWLVLLWNGTADIEICTVNATTKEVSFNVLPNVGDLSGLEMIRLKEDKSGFEARTIDEVRGDLGTPGSGALLREYIAMIPSADKSANGIKINMMAAGSATFTFGGCAYATDNSKFYVAEADSASKMPVVAISLGTPAANTPGDFLLYGVIRDDSWSWDGGRPVYMSQTINELTQDRPSTNCAIQEIGIALASNLILFNPKDYNGSATGVVSKTIDATWDNTYTDINLGFTPSLVTITAVRENDATFSGTSWGQSDGDRQDCLTLLDNGQYDYVASAARLYQSSPSIHVAATISLTATGFGSIGRILALGLELQNSCIRHGNRGGFSMIVAVFDKKTGKLIEAGTHFTLENAVESIGRTGAEAEAREITEDELKELTTDRAALVRFERDKLLAASDWTQLPDSGLAGVSGWLVYRQALRDITEQPGFPDSVEWPTQP